MTSAGAPSRSLVRAIPLVVYYKVPMEGLDQSGSFVRSVGGPLGYAVSALSIGIGVLVLGEYHRSLVACSTKCLDG